MTASQPLLGSRLGTILAGVGFSVCVGAVVSQRPLYAAAAIAGTGLLLFAMRHLAVGVAALTFAALLQQAPAFGGREVTVVKLMGAVLALAWIGQITVSGRADAARSRGGRHALAAAFVLAVWSFGSAAWALSSHTALTNATRVGQGILLLFIAYTAIRSRRDCVVVLGALVAGGIATTVIGYATGASAAYNQWGQFAPRRFAGFAGDPNELGAQLVPALTMCVIMAVAPGSRRRRVACLAAGAVLLAGLTATASRGAFVGLALALAAALLVIRGMRVRGAVAVAATVATALVVITTTAPPALAQRIWQFSDGGTGRSDLWRVATRITEDHPLLGVGVGNFPVAAPRYAGSVSVSRPDLVYVDPHVVHNTYLQFFAELGIVGGLLFLIVVVTALRRARSAAVRASSADGKLLARAVVAAAAGYLASLFFISGAFEKPLWVLLALSLRLPQIVAARPAEAT